MDFSRYAVPSKEWTTFADANPDAIAPRVFPESMEALQAGANAEREQFVAQQLELMGADKDDIVTVDYPIPTRDGSNIYARSYRPKFLADVAIPAFVYYHGGAFLFGSLKTEQLFGYTNSKKLSVAVIHICYRHTPQYQSPTQHEDAWDGFEWVMNNLAMLHVDPNKILVGGISAGANLAGSVIAKEIKTAKSQRRDMRVKGQVLFVPWVLQREVYPFHLYDDTSKASAIQCAEAPTFGKKMYDIMMDLLAAKDPKDPSLSPAIEVDEVLEEFPPTAIVVAGNDPLRDDGLYFAQRLEKAGYVVDFRSQKLFVNSLS
jgi:acetyl esterase/lipase